MHGLESIEEAITGALTLAEGSPLEELRRSRLTRAEIVRLLLAAGSAVESLAEESIPELDRENWAAALAAIRRGDESVLWSVLTSLAPSTLMWLRAYRTQADKL